MASSGTSKLLKGSFFIIIGNLLFRVGGYIYRVLMTRLLGPEGYGLLGLTLPFQGIFQILAAGGLPPAIAKYVAQHRALKEDEMARQVVITALKVMIFLGLTFSLVMFFTAPWLANQFFHKPAAQYPLQAVALITPFSVIVGAFRGAFQGIYRMEYVVVTRAVEQVFMITLAVVFVMAGFYAAGAVMGTAMGFLASAISAILIFKRLMNSYFPPAPPEKRLTIREELGLVKVLLSFSIPVIITALSEMAIYDISVFVIGVFMATTSVGYYTAADPIARLPLVVSLSVATAVLPAASEAFALKDRRLLETYIVQSYRVVTLLVLPMCVGIAVFSEPLLELLFGSNFIFGAGALSILVVGMSFYTLFMISSSIAQGIGYPRLPMYVLVAGTVINLALNVALVPLIGIEGGALATTIAAFIIMIIILWKTSEITGVKPPGLSLLRIGFSSGVMGVFMLLLPQTIMGLLLAIILSPLVYGASLLLIGGVEKRDVRLVRKSASRMGPLSGAMNRVADLMDRWAR
ncbi:oligosaccharide flippase family protein [Methanothermobacter marburgensis]|uniref:Predicted transporter protein n=1 Tax=Methanothermobacter marburgensis (strain ATCC BAA-927 / DSM 2133 / JCM 14651 / NBRC 100331 / OCM 82 / Marburg) TaxID=79929 RepID=D9PYX0_METTM|nr:oligosaccharide flippase family protein [Methanothermobacter marburgensis]ADL57665.1 predicted transporter protein [Methanothermobacter marburgensis str. Marburg]WBF09896.1 oligosaccharide flippase family protein [Methanothermobacter marburgensis]